MTCCISTLTFLALAVAGPSAGATEKTETSIIADAFAKRQVVGAFALLRKAGDGPWGKLVSGPAATERQVPASSFKIANSLVGLQTGVITAHEVFKWDGNPRYMKAWEKDLTLADAIKVSCVPCYQDVARRIGLDRMKSWLKNLGYGNADAGTVVDRFWLDGPLAISPEEQVQFVRRLYERRLPVDERHQDFVKSILLVEETASYRLFGKTGWAQGVEPNVGWYVGWVEAGSTIYIFATMVRVPASEANLMATVRKDLTLDILWGLGLPKVSR